MVYAPCGVRLEILDYDLLLGNQLTDQHDLGNSPPT